MTHPTKITLYSYFRSSCSARLRIALNLKAIAYSTVHINLLKGEQQSASYREINPLGSVPALVIEHPSQEPTTITQSVAAIEYLDEIAGTINPLLPSQSDPEGRAAVRTLTHIIACDIQPVTNLSIQKKVAELGANKTLWAKELNETRLQGYEAIVSETSGIFSVGDQITMADVCLVPAAWAAERVGVDLKAFPTISRILEKLEAEEAVKKAHWKNQPDTPEELRH